MKHSRVAEGLIEIRNGDGSASSEFFAIALNPIQLMEGCRC